MALANRKLNADLDTVFPDQFGYMYLSSSVVKDIAVHGGSVAGFVPDEIVQDIVRRTRKEDLNMATLDELINRMLRHGAGCEEGIPLAGEKCILERDQMLDLLDELRSTLPNDLQAARTS